MTVTNWRPGFLSLLALAKDGQRTITKEEINAVRMPRSTGASTKEQRRVERKRVKAARRLNR